MKNHNYKKAMKVNRHHLGHPKQREGNWKFKSTARLNPSKHCRPKESFIGSFTRSGIYHSLIFLIHVNRALSTRTNVFHLLLKHHLQFKLLEIKILSLQRETLTAGNNCLLESIWESTLDHLRVHLY